MILVECCSLFTGGPYKSEQKRLNLHRRYFEILAEAEGMILTSWGEGGGRMTGCCAECVYFQHSGPLPKRMVDPCCWKGHPLPPRPADPPYYQPYREMSCGDYAAPARARSDCVDCAHYHVTCAGVSADPDWDGRNGGCSAFADRGLIEALGIDIRSFQPKVRMIRQTTLEAWA